MAKKKTVKVQYRYVDPSSLQLGDDFDLKSVLVDILGRASGTGDPAPGTRARLRMLDLGDEEESRQVLLNKISDASSWGSPIFSGQLVQFEAGTDMPGFNGSLNEDGNEFVLENLKIGERQQIAKGVLYFACHNGHIALIEGSEVRSKTLEEYLTAFLRQAGEITEDEQLILPAKMDLRSAQVRQNFVSTAVTAKAMGAAAKTAGPSSVQTRTSQSDKVRQVLEILYEDEAAVQDVMQQIPEDGWMSLKTVFRFTRKSRKVPVERSMIERLVRNAPPEDVELLGPDGKEKGGILRLTETVRVEAEGGLLDPIAAMGATTASLLKWGSDGKIDIEVR